MNLKIFDLNLEIRNLKKKLHDFQTGEKYIQMQTLHRKELEMAARERKKLEKELAEAHAETKAVFNIWYQACEDEAKDKEKELARKDKKYKQLEKKFYELQARYDALYGKYKEKNLEIYEVKTQLEEANGKIQELTARVNRDYTNSSKSSAESPDHKKIQNSRKKTDRKPGGQRGHIHNGRKQMEPTCTVEIPAPEEYINNDNFKPTGKIIKKQLIVLKVSAEVIEFTTPEFRNQTTGQRVHADFPEGLKDDVTYDGSVKAFAYLLNNGCNVSIAQTQKFLREVSGGQLELSTGMICDLSRQFSEKTEEERNEIFLKLLASPVMHADFTFGRMNGKQNAVIVCATEDAVLYQAREKKGHEGVKGSPVELYQGTIVSDHESTFLNYGTRHQECMAHVERYVRSSIENEPELKWNREMLEWIQKAIHRWKEIPEGEQLSQEELSELLDSYDKIMQKAKEEYEYEPPSGYFRDGYNLYLRLSKDKEDYVLFLKEPSVPPTNNLAERCGRKYKRKSHQVIVFRSQSGSVYYCDGLSVIESLRHQNANVYEEIAKRFNQNIGA